MAIRVLVADDSSLMRLMVTDMLRADTELEVIDTASDGEEAAQKTAQLRPDVLVLDMNMARFDGLHAVRRIMQERPTPIVILSAVGHTDLSPVVEALRLGAYDYLTKPTSATSTHVRRVDQALIQKVKEAARVEQAERKVGRARVNQAPHTFADPLPYDVIAIGASTGGPGALDELLARLPGNMAVPVLIAQHMPPQFVRPFAERLNELTPLRVVVGQDQQLVQPGTVVVAPGDGNLVVQRRGMHVVLGFTPERFPAYNHPSVDALLGSVAEVYGARAIGVVLTGMGRDGTNGLGAIYRAGGFTIAQDQASSVVYGMPRAAAEVGCVRQVLPLAEIPGFLVGCLS